MAFYDKQLKPGEELIRIVRSYPLSYFPKIFWALLVFLLPFFFIIPLFKAGAIGIFAFSLVLFIGLILVIKVFALAYFNCFLITNQRVIDVDQRGLFDRVVSEAEYHQIQDVSYRVKGLIGTTLDYGSLQIQTPGAAVVLEIKNTRHPRKIQQLIADIKRNNS